MPFDLHITIPENSRHAQFIQTIAQQEQITPQEAAQWLLEEAIQARTQPTPARQMWGAFSSDEDVAMLDDIVAEAYTLRLANQPREFGN